MIYAKSISIAILEIKPIILNNKITPPIKNNINIASFEHSHKNMLLSVFRNKSNNRYNNYFII